MSKRLAIINTVTYGSTGRIMMGIADTAREAGMQVWGVYDDTSAEYEAEIRSVTQRYIRNFREIMAE